MKQPRDSRTQQRGANVVSLVTRKIRKRMQDGEIDDRTGELMLALAHSIAGGKKRRRR
jgi:hypothetical protein